MTQVGSASTSLERVWAADRPPVVPDDVTSRQQLSPRIVDDDDWARFQGYISEILVAFGLDPATPGTYDTPRRFLQALYDATSGYEGDPKLLTVFPAEGAANSHHGQVIQGPISFHALCEHHALPFHGVAHIAYVPGEHIIGISKLIRVVRLFARRFTVQERMGEQIAGFLTEALDARGVAVRIEAEHLCTQMRGVHEEQSKTVTTVWTGAYGDHEHLRLEFLHEARDRGGRR
ncbi:MAG TPA: GTP cyclohydrolase I [Pilimelia sp.]|nr:GTP cyclohydrolase I [Pilimelia sp.]